MALVEAHDAQLVHRDLKLSNIFLTTHGSNSDFVKVLDFGLVRELNSDERVTQSGITVGSPMFMAPEQISGGESDSRTDIYALGVVAYILLTGEPPFKLGTALAVCMAHLMTEPLNICDMELEREVPRTLSEIVARALKKDPAERFQSINALLEALMAYMAEETADSSSFDADFFDDSLSDEPDTLEYEASDSFIRAFAFLGEPQVEIEQILKPPAIEFDDRSDLEELRDLDLSDYVVFTDLNCPFCFAVHERLVRWALADSVQWRLVEHASHIIDGPLTMAQEALLAKEVASVHHRAPDVEIALPARRCSATRANRLLLEVQQRSPEAAPSLRTALYRAIWQDGLDVDDDVVLTTLLQREGLPALNEMNLEDSPSLLDTWQEEWQTGDFDCSIPIMTHPPTGRFQIGLGTERSLAEFLRGERTNVLDGAVCYYQRRPVILIGGRMQKIWPLISHLRASCEILQLSNPDEIETFIGDRSEPEVILTHAEFYSDGQLQTVADTARRLSIPWVCIAQENAGDAEVRALSMGASEFLPLDRDIGINRTRLHRVLRSRLTTEYLQRRANEDTLTRLPTRRRLIEWVEQEWNRSVRTASSLSLILLDLKDFRRFNDIGGYLAGDQSLQRFADMLRETVRPGDFVARFGGNEFVVVLPATGEENALDEAHRLKGCLEGLQIQRPAAVCGVYLTARFVVASQRPREGISFGGLFNDLDELMTQNKAAST
jgi:diguanylate cyclase (GGDEF)-like protein